MQDFLSEDDVKRLLVSPNAEVRADVAVKVAGQLSGLTDEQRKLAGDILRIMAKDAEVRVREALSRQVKDNPLIPHDVALSLVHDVDSVAVPILQFSEVLSDEDLLELVRSEGSAKLVAMAQRASVSTSVADALADSGDRAVVATLVANPGAELSEGALNRVAVRYSGADEEIGKSLAARDDLPVTVVEQLMAHVSDVIRGQLMARSDLPLETSMTLLVQARELAVLGLAQSGDVAKLVSHLARHNRLTASIVLRALCMGDLAFFESALAILADVSVENARALIHDKGRRGFSALYQKAGLPANLFGAMQAATEILADMEYDGGPDDRKRFSRRMIERILTFYGEDGVEFQNDDLEYLMTRMSQLPSSVTPAAGEA